MRHYLPNGSYVEVLRSTFESDTNVGSKGVKITVISMEDVPKLAKEMEK